MAATVSTKTVLIVPMFRVGYSTLFKPREEPSKKNPQVMDITWDCVAMFDPNEVSQPMAVAGSDPANPTMYAGGLVALAYEALHMKAGNLAKFRDPPPPAKPKYDSPFRFHYEFTNPRPEYEGLLITTLKTKNKKPGIVYADGKTPIETPEDLYPGCYCDASVNAWCWDYQGKIGVSFGLRNIRKLKDGEPLIMQSNPDADFATVDAKKRYGVDNSSMLERGKAAMIMDI